MKVCILGTARSGTSVLYTLLQRILLDNYDHNVEFIYEPFLWDKDRFNDILDEVFNNFDSMNSISIRGIYNHLELPLLIEDPEPFKNNEYLNSLFDSSSKKRNILLKFIRACGRYLLLHKISPETKYIFTIRNPADSANSITANFSFYGGEFFKDDFSRFINEVNRVYGKSYKREWFDTKLEKELFYWNYMNRFSLESFTKNQIKPLILCYEDILVDRNKYLQNICDYLQVPLKSKYKDLLGKKVGPVTVDHEAAESEIEVYKSSLDEYINMLKEHKIVYSFKKNEIIGKYKIVSEPVVKSKEEYGLTPLVIMNKLEEEKFKHAQLISTSQKQIEEFSEKLSEKDGLIKEKDELITEQNDYIKQKESETRLKDEIIMKKDHQIWERDVHIEDIAQRNKKKNEIIAQKEKTISQKDEIISQKDEIIADKDDQANQVFKDFEEKESILKQQIALSEETVKKQKSRLKQLRDERDEFEKRWQQMSHSSSFRLGSRILKIANFFGGGLTFFKKKK